eukprot:1148800-Pelagomonas_calceolata.AAC.9
MSPAGSQDQGCLLSCIEPVHQPLHILPSVCPTRGSRAGAGVSRGVVARALAQPESQRQRNYCLGWGGSQHVCEQGLEGLGLAEAQTLLPGCCPTWVAEVVALMHERWLNLGGSQHVCERDSEGLGAAETLLLGC